MCGPSVEVVDGITTFDAGRDPHIGEKAREAYARNRTGLLAEGARPDFAYQSLQMFNSETENIQLQAIVDKYLATTETATLPPNPTFTAQGLQYDFIRRMISSPNEATATIYLAQRQRHMDKPTHAERHAISAPENYFSIFAMLSHPLSRGNVHIRSADPHARPPSISNTSPTHSTPRSSLATLCPSSV